MNNVSNFTDEDFMKRFIIAIALLSSILCFPNGWSPAPTFTPKQKEKIAIWDQIRKIRHYYTNIGGNLASSCPAIFKLLKDIGSEASYEILQEMVKGKSLPKEYLDMA